VTVACSWNSAHPGTRRVVSSSSVSCVKFVASATAYVPVAGGHTGRPATRLRQRRLDRPPGLSCSSSAVSPQRSHAADFQLAPLRPCLRRSHQPSLAACSWANLVQSCRPGLQGPPRLCTVVLWSVYLRCRPTKSPRATQLPAATASFSFRFTVPLSAAEHFRLLALVYGTACHRRLRRNHLWQPSALDSRRSVYWHPADLTFVSTHYHILDLAVFYILIGHSKKFKIDWLS